MRLKKNFFIAEETEGIRWEAGDSNMKAFPFFSLVWLVKKIIKQWYSSHWRVLCILSSYNNHIQHSEYSHMITWLGHLFCSHSLLRPKTT